jgi:hypothetical protein
MVLVDGDVASDVVDSYMTWIACMLREIELMTLSGVHLYRLYCMLREIELMTLSGVHLYMLYRYLGI